MNSLINQTKQNTLQRGTDYCEKAFDVSGQQVINSYKCNQKHFSALDMWNIQKHSKTVSIRSLNSTGINSLLQISEN